MTQTTITPAAFIRPARRTTTPMTPVIKIKRTAFIGSPDSGRTRSECWGAKSTDDMWEYERIEDDGTSWYVTHLPTGYTCDQPYGSLTSARRATHDGTATQRMIDEFAEIANSDLWPADCRLAAERKILALLNDR